MTFLPSSLQSFKVKTPLIDRSGELIRVHKRNSKFYLQRIDQGYPFQSIVCLDMVPIPGGRFLMGATEKDKDSMPCEYPQHEVFVKPFDMSKYPITKEQWRVMAFRTDLKVECDLDPNPSIFKGDDKPVECVSWDDAVEFCARLSKLTRRAYRLPSEAEWEYACRAGTTTPFYFGETITGKLANYNTNYTFADEPKKSKLRYQTTPVGKFPPNAFGLYDMHGNVWEWCADNWHKNYAGAPNDGSAWPTKNDDSHVIRGGSWGSSPRLCRSAPRADSACRDHSIGFRVVSAHPETFSPLPIGYWYRLEEK